MVIKPTLYSDQSGWYLNAVNPDVTWFDQIRSAMFNT